MKKNKPCPKCQSQGGDKTGDHLFLMRDGLSWYCSRCEYIEKGDNEDENMDLSIEAIKNTDPLDIPDLKLTSDDLDFWGCKTLISSSTGEVESLLFPVKQDGEIKGYKGRYLGEVPEGKRKYFKASGSFKGKNDLFGQQLWENGRKLLIITEGEKDAIAVRKMLKAKGKSYCVVGLPNGANIESIKDNFEFINKFEKVLLIFDNDEAGKKAVDQAVSILPPGKVSVATLPEKDSFDMYFKGKTEEFWKCLQSANEKRPDGIILGKDTWDVIASRPDPVCLPYPEDWIEINKKTLGIRLGELDTWTAPPGAGKTQIFRQLRYHIWKATGPDYNKYFDDSASHLKDCGVGVISIEESLAEAVYGTLSIHLGERINISQAVAGSQWWKKFLGITEDTTNKDKLRQAWQEVMGDNRIHFYDHFGSLSEEGLLPKIQYMARSLNVKYLFLDHLNMVISEFADEGGERGKIDSLMTKLKKLTQELGIWIGLVVHLRKSQGGKPFEEGAVPSMTDLRGSMAIAQLSNSVYAITRNQQDEDEYRRNTSSLHVLKCRFTGSTGSAGFLHFDQDTGLMVPVDGINNVELEF